MTEFEGSLGSRMRGAALLDIQTYEAVEHDPAATGQAALVVALVAICQAIGGLSISPFAAVWAAGLALGSWVVWAGITYLVGEKIFQGEATWGEVMRTLGFAQTPGLLYILDIIPGIGLIASVVASLWIMVAGFIAIRQALDIGNVQTFLTILIGGGVYSVLQLVPLFPF